MIWNSPRTGNLFSEQWNFVILPCFKCFMEQSLALPIRKFGRIGEGCALAE
jgi:hypothetical protein